MAPGNQGDEGDEGDEGDDALEPFDVDGIKTLSYTAAALLRRISTTELDALHAELVAAQLDPKHEGGDEQDDEDEDDGATAVGISSATRLLQVRDRLEARDYANALLEIELALMDSPGDPLARRLAEQCRQVLARVYVQHFGDRGAIPHVAVEPDVLATHRLGSRAGFLMSRIDGHLSIEALIDVAGMPELEALHTLYELVERGLVRLQAPPANPRPRRARDVGEPGPTTTPIGAVKRPPRKR
jgi:hypothetical protein